MKRGAIFDMDGLLLDTERVYQAIWMETAEVFGQKPDPAFPIAVSGSNGEELRAVVRRFYPEVDPEAFRRRCLDRVETLLDESGAEVKLGAPELLAFFRDHGIKISVASSNSQERIRKNLGQSGLLPFFDAIASGLEVERGKPSPDVFLLAAKRIGIPPEDCYVFEDSGNGIRAASAAGCAPVMVPDTAPATEELRGLCKAVCSSLLEARDLISAGRL